MEYRNEIDGLRAVAVLSIILYHAGFGAFSGGFVGVDVFFVISGFLISSLLIDELERDDFSIARFYERRARRLLPALFVVLIACIPFAWLWMLPFEMKHFTKSVTATVVFSSNILFWRDSGYFDIESSFKPLVHTWSLALEEQYYLLFPLLLLSLWKLGRHRVFAIIIAIAVSSLLLSEYGWKRFPEANFFLAPTRIWELLAGSICAFWTVGRRQRTSNVLAIVGLALIIFSIFYYDKTTPFPSLFTLVPVGGTALILLYAHTETFVARLLSTKPLVCIGLVSYSAYLWHQPIFAFARIRSHTEPSQLLMGGLAIASLLLAVVTWKYVEQPFRKKSGRLTDKSQHLLISSACLGAALTTIGVIGYAWNGFPQRFLFISSILKGYEVDNEKLRQESWQIVRRASSDATPGLAERGTNKVFISKDKIRVLIIGNSHSKDLFNMFALNYSSYNNYEFIRFGVQLRQISQLDPKKLFSTRQYQDAQVILVSTRFSIRACGNRESKDYDDIDGLTYLLHKAIHEGKKVIVASNTVEFEQSNNRTIADEVVMSLAVRKELKSFDSSVINRLYFQKRQRRYSCVNEKLKDITKSAGVPYLDKEDFICDRGKKKCYAISQEGEKYFYDYGHYTMAGAKWFGAQASVIGWFDGAFKEK